MMWLEICFSRKQVEFPRNYVELNGGECPKGKVVVCIVNSIKKRRQI